MAVETYTITDRQRDLLQLIVEGHFLDAKSKDISPSSLTISGFANADGV
ncbi:MAG: hypothetical protein ACR2LM_01365 [Pyrinomonadaceae bacterium]